jgi:hypothetical protein
VPPKTKPNPKAQPNKQRARSRAQLERLGEGLSETQTPSARDDGTVADELAAVKTSRAA